MPIPVIPLPEKSQKAWFPLSHFRPRQRLILSQNKAIAHNRFVFCVVVVEFAVNRNQAKGMQS